MIPDPTNPIILVYRGHTAALKNNKVPVTNAEGRVVPITSGRVKRWLKLNESDLQTQWRRQEEEQGFTTILKPNRVVVMAYVSFFVTFADSIPDSDLDNAYTTLQETLQRSNKPNGIVGAMEDDNQIIRFMAEEKLVPNKALEGALVYVWQANEQPLWGQQALFEVNREKINSRLLYNSQVPELLDLLNF